MWIKKILNIQNLWRFSQFSSREDNLSFSKNTFIYWKNTHGKSTLTSIFRSLETLNTDFIVWRKTFDSTWNQQITIETDDWNVIFDWTSWKNNNLKLKIFDTRYIIENIYSDETLDEDKQKKIISIILWSKWRILEENYTKAKNQINENTQKKTEITKSYWMSFNKDILGFDKFRKLNLNDCENIDTKISDIEEKIKSLNNQSQIIQILNEISTIFQKVENANLAWLKETLTINQEKINLHIEKHIKNEDKALDFLSKWVDLLNDKREDWLRNCVFCGQILSNESENLILDFNTLFSEQYRKLNALVNGFLNAFNDWSITNDLLIKQSKLQTLWLVLDFSELVNGADEKKKELISELNKKKDNLNYVVNIDSYESIKVLFSEFFKKNLTEIIKKYSVTIGSDELLKLRNEKVKYEIIKKRYEKPWKDSCNDYDELERKFSEELKPAEETAFNEKNEYAKTTLTGYESSINWILEKLWANFKLVDFSVPENRRGQLKLFSLKFSDCNSSISLDWEENQNNFKNTLSESDKRLLAFSFFITDIKNTKNLDEYVIVLDDPMSSFDIERKNTTIKVLRDELVDLEWKLPNQLIVLTHEDNFFRFLNEHFSENKKFLRISYNRGESTSKILNCDINEEFLKDEHFKNLDYYKQVQSCWDYTTCDLWKVRIILEHIIDRKYYLDIEMTIRERWWILKWYYDKVTDTTLKTSMDDLFPNISHHDQPKIKEWDLSDWDKKDIIDNLLRLVNRI